MLSEVNKSLKALSCPVSVVKRGSSLYLRATLPPKPNSGKINPHRQWISLGLKSNPEGLTRAKNEAIKLGALISLGEFDWSLYLKFSKQYAKCGDWCDSFRDDYFSKRKNCPSTISTYRTNYRQCFNKLPSGRKLTAKLLKDTLLKIPPGTKARSRHAVAFQKLATYAGIDCDLLQYRGDYSYGSLSPRNLPTDSQIIGGINLIPNPSWRWGAAVIATYGIRPHELFFADLSDPPLLYVSEGKTGSRHVAPFYPEWLEEFGLIEQDPPPHSGKDYTALGCRVSRQFRRYGLPFKPYDLRHCYARRCKEFGIKPIDAAKMMGHSLDVHFKTYHHWYCKDDVIAIAESVANCADRPRPPRE